MLLCRSSLVSWKSTTLCLTVLLAGVSPIKPNVKKKNVLSFKVFNIQY